MKAEVEISILIACRNEAKNIRHCLEALANLDYPIEKLEILIGDDESEDETAEIIQGFIQDQAQFHYYWVSEAAKKAPGKAGVIDFLFSQSQGKLIYLSDADVEVSPQWLRSAQAFENPEIGVLTGLCLLKGEGLFAKLQNLDWAWALYQIHLAGYWGLPTTALGNHMAFRREAYLKTGGYSALEFSLTEDYQLFREILKVGYEYHYENSPQTLVRSRAQETFWEYLAQRKRWMRGAMGLAWPLKLLLYLQESYLLWLLILAYMAPFLSLKIMFLKFLFQSVGLAYFLVRVGESRLLAYLPLHELYRSILGPISLIYYFSTRRIRWKGREYP